MSYRIKRVALLTGINPATLRAWERRYNLIAPDRTHSGYRLYSDEDVAMLARIKQLTDEGLTIGEAIVRAQRGWQPLENGAEPAEVAEVTAQLREALLGYDRQAALSAWERLEHLPPERRAEEVLLPLMREVGELWEHREAGVAQEHFASGFVREKLAGMIAALDTGAAPGPEAVCAGAPGEGHEFGLMACALRLAAAGWKVLYLGADVPLEETRRVVGQRRPALLCTSVVRSHETAEFATLAASLRRLAPAATAVVMGGRGIPQNASPPQGVRLAGEVGELLAAG
jgi:DNA-binding transcriptional MerR regulator